MPKSKAQKKASVEYQKAKAELKSAPRKTAKPVIPPLPEGVPPMPNPKKQKKAKTSQANEIPPGELMDSIYQLLYDYNFTSAVQSLRAHNQKRPGFSYHNYVYSAKDYPPLLDIWLQWEHDHPDLAKKRSAPAPAVNGSVAKKHAEAEDSSSDEESDEESDESSDDGSADKPADAMDVDNDASESEDDEDSSDDSSGAPVEVESESETPDAEKVPASKPKFLLPVPATEPSSDEDEDEDSDESDDSSDSSDSSKTASVEEAKTIALPESDAETSEEDSAEDSSASEAEDDGDDDESSSEESSSDSDDSEADLAKKTAVVASAVTAPVTAPVSKKRKLTEDMEEETPASNGHMNGARAAMINASNGKRVKHEPERFSRIPKDVQVDDRFASNKYVSYDYADRAHANLIVTKGKGFTKAKNKGKRGSYRGGAIDTNMVRGIKFED